MTMLRDIFIIVVAGVLAGAAGAALVTQQSFSVTEPSKNKLIADFYAIENAVHVSPHGLRKKMEQGDDSFVLVDLRSQQEYEAEHIIGAVNIPAYKDPDTSAYDEVDRIVNEFKQLPVDKNVIVYCYSIPCMTGRKIGKMLADHGIYVQQLGIGWNEWRYYWTLWNHEGEWDKTRPETYVSKGKDPGRLRIEKDLKDLRPCPVEGEFGC